MNTELLCYATGTYAWDSFEPCSSSSTSHNWRLKASTYTQFFVLRLCGIARPCRHHQQMELHYFLLKRHITVEQTDSPAHTLTIGWAHVVAVLTLELTWIALCLAKKKSIVASKILHTSSTRDGFNTCSSFLPRGKQTHLRAPTHNTPKTACANESARSGGKHDQFVL